MASLADIAWIDRDEDDEDNLGKPRWELNFISKPLLKENCTFVCHN